MKLEDRINQHLSRESNRISSLPDSYERVRARGRRRKVVAGIAAAGATAAMVVAFVAASTLLLQDTAQPVATVPLDAPTETTIPSVATTSNVVVADGPAAYVSASTDGVTVVSPDGTSSVLTGDRWFESIASVIPDEEGGIIFTHTVTPMEWPQGSLVRLAPGASRPTLLVPAMQERVPLVPIRVIDGTLYFWSDQWFGTDDNLYAVPIDGSAEPRPVADLSGLMDEEGDYVQSIAVSETGVLVVSGTSSCSILTGFELGESSPQIPTAAYSCDRDGPITTATLSPSGNTMFLLLFRLGEPVLRTVDLRTGSMTETGIEGWGAWAIDDDTVVVTADPTSVVDAGEVTPIDGAPADGVVAVSTVPLDVAADATLGTGSGKFPCEVVANAPIDLPGPVGDKLNAIRTAAAACDFEALDALAREDDTAFTFGEGGSLAGMWITEARTLGENPRDKLLAVTALRPQNVESDLTYTIWPAVAETNAPEDWDELEQAGVFADTRVEAMREDGMYYEFRVAISADGRWMFAIAGD